MGTRGRRGNRHRVLLYVAVARVNDVLVNVASDSTYVLGFGHRSDLEVVERLWTSLAVQMTGAAQRRLDAGEHRASRVPALTWRLSFYDGWTAAVATRLAEARQKAVVQDAARPGAPGSSGASAELVLRAKGERVRDFYATASSARGSWRGAASGRTQVSGRAFQSGRDDGQRADLGQPRLRRRGQLGT